jgi:hypothetical protein
MKKTVLFLIMSLALVATVVAQTATIQQTSGKVEVRVGSRAWAPAVAGQEVPLDATISTGFGASAVLQVGSSTIEVAQLTRLTIEELADDGSTVSTGVFVPVGQVRASVAAPPDRSNDFTIRTAQSTAAVRGTEFETNGWQLTVSEGIVEFANLLGESRNVSAEQISSVADGSPSEALEEMNANTNIGSGDFDFGPSVNGVGTGAVTVRW